MASACAASGYGPRRREEDEFPAGLRVLVVDDDETCLKILESMLRRCRYHGELLLPFWCELEGERWGF